MCVCAIFELRNHLDNLSLILFQHLLQEHVGFISKAASKDFQNKAAWNKEKNSQSIMFRYMLYDQEIQNKIIERIKKM